MFFEKLAEEAIDRYLIDNSHRWLTEAFDTILSNRLNKLNITEVPTTDPDTPSQTPTTTRNGDNSDGRNQRRRGGISARNRNLVRMESSVKYFS